jgi:prepilin-type N-terminal cleavage/methylation domain-containing protein
MRPFVSSLRKGFTLPEVLVTVAVVSVLAAAVVPAVVNQVTKGDLPALQADLNSIRGAIGNFTTDVKRYPRKMSDLTKTLSSPILSTDLDINGTTYGVGAADFRGPYLTSKIALSDSTLYKTASLSLSFANLLTVVDGHIAVTVLHDNGTDQISSGDAANLKTMIDGGFVATPSGTQTNSQTCISSASTGMVRIAGLTSTLSGVQTGAGGTCSALSGTVTSVKILLVQIGG